MVSPTALYRLTDSERIEACGDDPRFLCDWVADRSDSVLLAQMADVVVDKPLRVALIVVGALVLSRLFRIVIGRWGARLATTGTRRLTRLRQRNHERVGHGERSPAVENGRSELRVTTVISVVTSLSTVVVWTIALLWILSLFEIDLAPLFAGAGVLGVALGFGAQSVVADFLSGFFMLFEDQFGVGDVVDVGEVSGTVEELSLRTTTLRDVNGTVWHIRNSEILRVGNKSQLWSRAVLDIDVAYDSDLRRAEGIIQRVADQLWQDESFTAGDIIDPPEVWGVERLGADGVSIRLVVRTDPAEQWVVARELRLRIKEALDEAGIEIPFPQRTIWLRQDEAVPRELRPEVETAPLRAPAVTDDLVENPD